MTEKSSGKLAVRAEHWLSEFGLPRARAGMVCSRLWIKSEGDRGLLALLRALAEEDDPRRLLRAVVDMRYLCAVDLPDRISRLRRVWDSFWDWLEARVSMQMEDVGEVLVARDIMRLDLYDRLLVLGATHRQAVEWAGIAEELSQATDYAFRATLALFSNLDASVWVRASGALYACALSEQPWHLRQVAGCLRRIETLIRLRATAGMTTLSRRAIDRLKAYATKLDPGIRDSLAAVPRNPDDARSDWLTAFEAAFRRLVARGKRGPGGLSGAFSRMLWSPADVDGLLGTLGELGLWPAGLRTVRGRPGS